MMPEHRVHLEDEPCPVADQMLGEMYRASAQGLNELIATVSPTVRVLLAVYCYRRAHLAWIGLAIAASCGKDELASAGVTLARRCSSDPGKPQPPCPLMPKLPGGQKLLWRSDHFGG